MDNDEFLKEVLKYGKIKPVEEAFKEFPVEEEEHKGKIDSYLKKNREEFLCHTLKSEVKYERRN